MRFTSIHLAFALIIVIGLGAVGCGGLPLPEEPQAYTTSVEKGGEVDIIHVNFDMFFKNPGSKKDILAFLDKCIDEGSCGTMARVVVDDEIVDRIFSCSCDLTDKGEDTVKQLHQISATCSVPLVGVNLNLENKQYRVMITSVAPNNITSTELAFSTSPEVTVQDMEVKSLQVQTQIKFGGIQKFHLSDAEPLVTPDGGTS